MELPAKQVYSPASSADTLRRYRTSTSELLMSVVWGWETHSGVTAGPRVRKGAGSHPPHHGRRVGRAQAPQGLDLQDLHIREAVGTEVAAVDDNVLQPLDVRLGVTVHLA